MIRADTTDRSPYLNLQASLGFKLLSFIATAFMVENAQMLTGGIVKIDVSARILASIGRTMGVGYAAEMSYPQTVDAFIKLDLGGFKIGNGPAPTSPFSPKPSNAASTGAGAVAMSLVIAPVIHKSTSPPPPSTAER
ncbi:hypothetical protein DFQ26_008645 [Actinomortierella ambigua]|nr:hypothetical protein DFQ26_008645 [Actinomortierella ambigua]